MQSATTKSTFHNRYLHADCEKYQPSFLSELPQLFDDYRGREDVLFGVLAERFGPTGLRHCPIPTVAPKKTDGMAFDHIMLSEELAVGPQPLKAQVAAIASSHGFASVLSLRPYNFQSNCACSSSNSRHVRSNPNQAREDPGVVIGREFGNEHERCDSMQNESELFQVRGNMASLTSIMFHLG